LQSLLRLFNAEIISSESTLNPDSQSNYAIIRGRLVELNLLLIMLSRMCAYLGKAFA